jgi:hypothetical protein
MITFHERSTEVAAPAARAFAVIRDPANWPVFLRGVETVRRRDETSLTFTTADGRTWPAVLTEVVTDVSVGWTSRGEPLHTGLLTLERTGRERTRVTLRLDHDLGAGGDPTADLDRLGALVDDAPRVPGTRSIVSLAAAFDHPVTDSIGEPVGAVRDLHLDLDEHAITSLAVGDAGDGAAYLVPIPPIPVAEAALGMRIPYPAEIVPGAPRVEPGVEPGPELLDAARRHFEDPSEWRGRRAAARARHALPPPIPELQALGDAGLAPGVPSPTPEIADAERGGDTG